MSFGRRRKITLALQGGGAHGAYTWGVLDRLLEEDGLHIEGISGSSAGAMNGAALASGWLNGGRGGARQALEKFWREVSEAGRLGRLPADILDRMTGGWSSSSNAAMGLLTRYLSPYQLNPLDINPLRRILEKSIDFDGLRDRRAMRLFVAASDVASGRGRVFENADLTCDALLASACLPHLHKAMEIGGRHYWDGGFTANPALFPAIFRCRSRHLVIVQIDPATVDELPRSAAAINTRLSQIMFNAPMMRELEALDLMRRVARETFGSRGRFGRKMRRLRIHLVESDVAMRALPAQSKLNPDWGFITDLRELGRAAAERWLSEGLRRSNKATWRYAGGHAPRHAAYRQAEEA